MKKILLIFLLLINLFACQKENISDNHEIKIVTTIFSAYDWTKELSKGNDNIKVEFLLDNGIDLHNYQASAKDIITINESDIFIYVGGESDEWVDDILDQIDNDLIIINLLEELGDKAKLLETKDGMQEEDHDHDHDHEEEYDEHIWLSLKNAEIFIEIIKNKLIEIDNIHKDIYENNYNNYLKELKKLDQEYENVISNAKNKTLLFADRFPFRYLIDDYNLDYYAAFVGCSAESEASFETIAFLTNKIDELELNYIVVLEDSNNKIANTIIENSKYKNAQIEILDSIQNTTTKDNKTYLSIMKNNLTVLERILY